MQRPFPLRRQPGNTLLPTQTPSSTYLPAGRRQHGAVGFQHKLTSVPLIQKTLTDKLHGRQCGYRRIFIIMYVIRPSLLLWTENGAHHIRLPLEYSPQQSALPLYLAVSWCCPHRITLAPQTAIISPKSSSSVLQAVRRRSKAQSGWKAVALRC